MLLRRLGKSHTEIGAGLAQGTTLADQARVVDGLLRDGVSREELRAVLVDRPYPAPAERKRSMAALIAARLTHVCPPISVSPAVPVPAQASATPTATERAAPVKLQRTRRPECPEYGIDSPDGQLCGSCQG
ncbi:hypothetical protein [Streptomyces sp. NPDC006285]|uniref:hypothetical protein n=1 Tax=Streptomyces sp. NPDC006285 TaxID=3364742 RepID=UPI00369B46D8